MGQAHLVGDDGLRFYAQTNYAAAPLPTGG
jgi:hypothetical protein